MRIDRMLAIIVILLNRDRITARKLADKFEVSVRTIYRDIEAINTAGIQVKTKVEDSFGEEQIHFLDNGDMIARVSYPEDEWVYSTILSCGEHVEVLEPLHIRKIIRGKAKKILEHYKPDMTVSQA